MIPGVQGRWEWMVPAVDALAGQCRVITGSLAGDRGSVGAIDPAAGFENYVVWVDALLDRARLTQTALCGVSYGGLVALHYAASRPDRVRALILVSTPSPTWKPNCRVEWYLRAPRLLLPVFALSSPFRLYPELVSAFPNLVRRGAFAMRYLHRVTRYPLSPTRMAERVRLLSAIDFAEDCLQVKAPTLVITGEPDLDRVGTGGEHTRIHRRDSRCHVRAADRHRACRSNHETGPVSRDRRGRSWRHTPSAARHRSGHRHEQRNSPFRRKGQ